LKQNEARDIVLQTLEIYADLQKKTVQELRERLATSTPPSPRRGRRRRSLVDMSYEILTSTDTPLHVSELVEALRRRYGRVTDRDALSSALAKKARQGRLFEQTAPATFAARPEPEVAS
jgi:hypothetical protein